MFEASLAVPACVGDGADASCAGPRWHALPEGASIPEGSALLRVEGDAGAAVRSDGWIACVQTVFNSALHDWDSPEHVGEVSRAAMASWNFPLGPEDWDPPGRPTSGLRLCLLPAGALTATMEGPVMVRLVAVRDPSWTPVAAPDPWNLSAEAPPVAPDGLLVLDRTFAWRHSPRAAEASAEAGAPTPALDGVIPNGTKQVALGLAWSAVAGCPSAASCSFRAHVLSAAGEVNGFGSWRTKDAARILYVFDVPAAIATDSHYVSNSTAWILAFAVVECPANQGGECARPAPFEADASVRLRVEAWRSDLDVDAFWQRLEPSALD